LGLFGFLLTAWFAFYAFGARLSTFADGFRHAFAAARAVAAEARSRVLGRLLAAIE
jgi:hypothetical protein